MSNEINLRAVDSIGCSVASIGVVLAIKEKFPEKTLIVYTKFPELFNSISGITLTRKELSGYDVDLRSYYANRLHNNLPYRSIYINMIEIAENALKTKLRRILPKIVLSQEELDYAKKILDKNKKPTIWIQKKTNSPNKNWIEQNWKELEKKLSLKYAILELSESNYSLRQSLALTKLCLAGITLDTFLVHGSNAVGAKNVLVLLGSSRKEVVTYPTQKVVYIKSNCPVQPCGMHGYAIGCKPVDETLFKGHEKTRCITDDYRCMTEISVDKVITSFEDMLKN
jgi:ADP-heptose:LPS heptosyltransferase